MGGRKTNPDPPTLLLLLGSGSTSRFAKAGRLFNGFTPFLGGEGSSTHCDAGLWAGEGSGVNKQSICKSGWKCINGKRCIAWEWTPSRRELHRGLEK